MQSRRNFIGKVAGGLAGSFAASNVMGASDRVRIGIIGPGARGSEILREALACPNTECVAAADVYTRRLEEVKLIAPEAKTYLDYRHLLEDKSIDAVLIATPQHLHAEHFTAALDAGKHVYQEKTMAFTVDACQADARGGGARGRAARRPDRPPVDLLRPRSGHPGFPQARAGGQGHLHRGAHVPQHAPRQAAVGAPGLSRHDAREHRLEILPGRGARRCRSTPTATSTGAFSGIIPAATSTKTCATSWPSGTR